MNRRTPIVFESGKHGEQAYDIFSWLSRKKQIIYIDDVITDDTANCFMAQLYCNQTQGQNEVELIINSPGGSVHALFTILDGIDMAHAAGMTIKTTCVGMAASAAAILLCYGTPGHRSATKRASIMLHDISSRAAGTSKDIERQHAETMRMRNEIAAVLVGKTLITNPEEYMDRDEYIVTNRAIDLGIIDHVKEDM